MGVESVRSLGSVDPQRIYQSLDETASSRSFASTLKDALAQVNELQQVRDEKVAGVITGEVTEVHDVMAAAKEAQLAFELLLEIRNRLLESYQEIMKTSV